jgi:hypothetical protein
VPKLAILSTTNVFVFGKISSLGDQKKRQCKSGFFGKKLAFSKLNVILGLHKIPFRMGNT